MKPFTDEKIEFYSQLEFFLRESSFNTQPIEGKRAAAADIWLDSKTVTWDELIEWARNGFHKPLVNVSAFPEGLRALQEGTATAEQTTAMIIEAGVFVPLR